MVRRRDRRSRATQAAISGKIRNAALPRIPTVMPEKATPQEELAAGRPAEEPGRTNQP